MPCCATTATAAFTQVPPQEHGAGLEGQVNSGPAFADIDADGWPDLVVGGVAGSGYHVFRNQGNGQFIEITAATGIIQQETLQNDFSSAFGDPDGDGDLDLFVGHWGAKLPTNHYWINRGAGSFVASDLWAGIDVFADADHSFAPTFTDINGDRIQDLLVTSDYHTSQVLMCAADGQFALSTTDVIDDDNGMGSAAADFDNDGDIDWFVSSIWDEAETHTWEGSGNRLYLNDGSGTFTDATESAGIVVGHWGWGACAADFNNDGWLDIFHVNGFPSYGPNQTDFTNDRSMLYINNQDGTFTERSESLHLDDTGQGRGVVCFDYDMDGDVDVFTSNWEGFSKLYRNDLEASPGYLQVRLHGEADNPDAVGATIRVTAQGITQMREITVGSNYASQNPLLQHFGLGTQIRSTRWTCTGHMAEKPCCPIVRRTNCWTWMPASQRHHPLPWSRGFPLPGPTLHAKAKDSCWKSCPGNARYCTGLPTMTQESRIGTSPWAM